MRDQELARERFDGLYREYGQALYAYLTWSVGDKVVAEDLLADVFERALRHRWRFDRRRGSERAWLYAIAVNRVRDHVRRAGSEGRAVERLRTEVSVAAGHTGTCVEQPDLADALLDLSEDERQVVALRFGADLTVEQIAATLRETRTTVEGRLYRGLRKLRERLDER